MRKIKVILMSVLLALFIAGCSSGTSAEFFESGSQISGKTEQSDSGMEVHFIDVGQGDATLIKAGDHAMLIDAGDNSEGTAVQSYLNSQGIEKLDYVIGTHPDADHIGGLDVVVYKFDCKKIFMPAYIVTFTAPHLSVLSLSYMLLTVFIITSSFGESKSCMSILMIIFIMISTPLHFIGQVTLSVTLYRTFSLITLT